jgi:hypothetical protein
MVDVDNSDLLPSSRNIPGTVAGTISVEELKAMTSQIERVKKALDELTDRINYLEYWMNRVTSD